ncbi:MAG: NTP transferase domain-containing protein [Bacteroidota bacterium]
MRKSVSAIITAAGSSGRMGSAKALLRHASGSSFARYLLNCFGLYGCNPVILVVSEELDVPELRSGSHQLAVNHHPELGRSHSIHIGLQYVPEGSACFIHNVDNPFLSPELLDELIRKSHPDSYTVPVYQKHGGHPILPGSGVVDFMRNLDQITDFRELLNGFTRIEIPWRDKQILWNVNTPEDYENYLQFDQP